MKVRWPAWRLDAAVRVVGVAAAVGLVTAVVLVVANASRGGTTTVPAELRDPACETAQPAAPDFAAPPFAFDPVARAQAFAQALTDGDSQTAYEMLAFELLPYDSFCEYSLKALWRSWVLGLDPRETTDGARVVVDSSAPLVFVPIHDQMGVWLRVVLPRGEGNSKVEVPVVVFVLRDGRVVHFEPDRAVRELGPVADYPPPPYADLTAFEEFELMLGEAPWQISGTLTVPHGPGPYPAVVLVEGLRLRPDRDGTVAATKGNRDLAWGLASRGIATLRYDQRTWTHALAFARQDVFTINDEWVEDALAAVRALRQTPRIDSARLYVLGISFGGFAAPRVARQAIAQQAPDLAGLIIVSSPSGAYLQSRIRGLEVDLEIGDWAGNEDVTEDVMRHILEQTRARIADIEALAAGEAVMPDMSVRPSYHLDLATYRPEANARFLRMPLLVLHGNADTRLTRDDAIGWMEELQSHPDVVFRLYADHRHGLLDLNTASGPKLRPQGYVGTEVIENIAAWIGGARPVRACSDPPALLAGCRGGMVPGVPSAAK